MVQHPFAEVALLAIGLCDRRVTRSVTVPAAIDILRRADRDRAARAAERIVVLAETCGRRRLVARGAGAKREGQQRECYQPWRTVKSHAKSCFPQSTV